MMLRNLLIFLLLAGAAQAQVTFYCNPSSEGYSQTLFKNKRTWKNVLHWTCTFYNGGEQPYVLTEAGAMRALQSAHVRAMSTRVVQNMFVENQRRGPLAPASRLLGYAIKGAQIWAGLGVGKMSDSVRSIIVVGGETVPDLAAAIKSRAPSVANFATIAWQKDVGIPSRGAVAVSLFSAPWPDTEVIEGKIEDAAPVPSTPLAPLQPPQPTPLRFRLWSESLMSDVVVPPVVAVRWPSPDHRARWGDL